MFLFLLLLFLSKYENVVTLVSLLFSTYVLLFQFVILLMIIYTVVSLYTNQSAWATMRWPIRRSLFGRWRETLEIRFVIFVFVGVRFYNLTICKDNTSKANSLRRKRMRLYSLSLPLCCRRHCRNCCCCCWSVVEINRIVFYLLADWRGRVKRWEGLETRIDKLKRKIFIFRPFFILPRLICTFLLFSFWVLCSFSPFSSIYPSFSLFVKQATSKGESDKIANSNFEA